MFGLLSPVEGVQEYPVPPEAFSVVLSPLHIALSEPAFAANTVAIVTIAESIAVQPLVFVTDDPEFTPGATLAVWQTYALSSAVAGAIAPESDLAATNIVSLLMVAYSASQAVLDISNSGAVHA